MQTTETTINPAPPNNGSLLGRIKEMLAYIVCPIGRRPPTSSDIAHLAASPFDKFHVGALRLIKAAAKMFAGGADRELAEVHPWDCLGQMERGEESGARVAQDSAVQSRTEFDSTMIQEDELLDRLEKGLSLEKVVEIHGGLLNAAHTSRRAVVSDCVIDAQAPERAEQPSFTPSTHTDPVYLGDELINSIEEFLDELESEDRSPLQSDPFPPTHQYNGESRRQSNKIQPLRKRVLKRLLPKFTKRATIPLRCNTKVLGLVESRYSDDRPGTRTTHPHLPVASKHEVRRKPGYPCLRLETRATVAPNREKPGYSRAYENVGHSARNHVAEVTAVVGGVSSSNPLPNPSARDVTRDNASVPPSPLKISRNLDLASLQAAIDATAALQAFIEDEYSIPSRSCSPIEEEDSEVLPAGTFASRQSKAAHGRPTCMGDWLTQLGTGTNPLVEDEIAAQAAQLVEIMRPSLSSPSSISAPSPSASSCTSGSSTPSDSPPVTPTSAIEPVPACYMAEKTEAARRSRARCSYDGGVFDTVVALELPEELLTEEVGVAC